MGRMSYDQLMKEYKKLKSRVEEFEHAGKWAFITNSERYISIPLTAQQKNAAMEHYDSKRYYNDCSTKTLDDGSIERHYQEVHDSIFAEFRSVLIRYATDLEGNDVSSIGIWGLIPV